MFETSIFPKEFEKVAQKCYMEQMDAFSKLFEDEQFYKRVMSEMAKAMYLNYRDERNDAPKKVMTYSIMEEELGEPGSMAAENEAPNSYNTLYLPIKQVYFDQIIEGTKKIEYREVKDTTAKRYLLYTNGKPELNPDCTDPNQDYYLDDFNEGKFPFLPKQYKYLSLAVGYSQNRDTAIVEVDKITFKPEMIRANKFCFWIEEFHIGRVVEIHRKK